MLNLKKTLAAFASAAVICSSLTGITPVSSVYVQPEITTAVAEEAAIPVSPPVTTATSKAFTAATTTHAFIDYQTALEYDDSPMTVGETRAVRFFNPDTKTGTNAVFYEASANIEYEYKKGEDTVYITAVAPGKVKLYIMDSTCAFGEYVNLEVINDVPQTATTATVLPSTIMSTTHTVTDVNKGTPSETTVSTKRIDPLVTTTANHINGTTPETTTSIPSTKLPVMRFTETSTSIPSTNLPVMRFTETSTSIPSTNLPVMRFTVTTTSIPSTKLPVMRGTGVDIFKEVITYPTKVIYDAGEALDLSGMKVKVSHSYSVMYSDGTGEYISNDFDKEIAFIEPEHITIVPYGGAEMKYSDEEFGKLMPGTKYKINISGTIRYKSDKSKEYYDYIYDANISFDVYINEPGNKSQFIKIDNAEIEKFEYGSYSKGFVLESYEPMSIDMDAAMNIEYHVPYMEAGDTISAVIYMNTESRYIITGDFTIVKKSYVYGDANGDNKVTLADSLTILQFIANEEKYPLTEKQQKAADCFNTGDGITAMDALTVQRLDTGAVTALPVFDMPPVAQ